MVFFIYIVNVRYKDYNLFNIGFPVVITLRELRVITRNTFIHLRRSITRNYAFITFTKERLVSRN